MPVPVSQAARLDLARMLPELRCKLPLFFAVAAGAAALAFGLSQRQSERYVATADLLFRAEAYVNAPERTAETNLVLADLNAVIVGVRRRLNSGESLEDLRKRVELQPRGQADVLRIAASAGSARGAARLANAFAEEVVAGRRATAVADVQRRIDALDASLAQTDPESALAGALAERRNILLADKALVTGDVEIADLATAPRERAAPKPLRNAAVAGMLGFVMAMMLVVALRTLDRRLTEQQVVELFGAPVLALVPARGSRATWRRLAYVEAFEFLRANVLAILGEEAAERETNALSGKAESHVVVVTSPMPGDGRSSTVARLGEALAAAGARVLALDGDLRKPTLAREFGLREQQPGLADMVDGQSAARFLQETDVGGLSVLAGGAHGGADTAGAAWSRLRGVIEALRTRADLVLVDTPPVMIDARTSILASEADGVLVVLDARNLDPDTLTAARDQLERAHANILGLVLNFADAPHERKLRADYGAYGPHLPDSRTATPSPAVDPPIVAAAGQGPATRQPS